MKMDEREEKNQIQCIVDEGIVVNRRDMVRILRDLGHVHYTDLVNDQVRSAGEGVVTSVFNHLKGSTIFVNKRLYINVNSFDFLRLSKNEDDVAVLDLVDDRRTVRLMPLSDPLHDRQVIACDPGLMQAGSFDRLIADDFAEVYGDEDPEDDDN